MSPAKDKSATQDASILDVAYHPGFACNLSCTYCYQLPEIAAEKLNKPRLPVSARLSKERMADFIVEHARVTGNTSCNLTLLGGEPLLYLSDIELMHEAVASRIDIGSVSMITNAVLIDDQTIERLKAIQCVNLQITLDGHGSHHDGFRSKKNGVGTYSDLVDMIIYLDSLGFSLSVRVNVTSENISSVTHIFSDLAPLTSSTSSTLYFALIDDTETWQDTGMRAAFQIAEQYGNLHLEAASLGFNVRMGGHYGGCRTCKSPSTEDPSYLPQGLVLAADGNLYSCWDSAGQTGRVVGTIATGFDRSTFEERWVQCGYQGGRDESLRREANNRAYLGMADGRAVAERLHRR